MLQSAAGRQESFQIHIHGAPSEWLGSEFSQENVSQETLKAILEQGIRTFLGLRSCNVPIATVPLPFCGERHLHHRTVSEMYNGGQNGTL